MTNAHASAGRGLFSYLHPGFGVLLDPLDDRLVDQLLRFGVEAVVGQIRHQILLGHVENLLLSRHLRRSQTEGQTAGRSEHTLVVCWLPMTDAQAATGSFLHLLHLSSGALTSRPRHLWVQPECSQHL